MSIALYRKYRPATFGEVRGQEHVTDPLRQALRSGRINHAYLFSGPRGCGKTTSARILARSLNCAEGPTPDPCGTCDSCVALAPDGGGSIDVIEIDAASHGGVDDARDLRERAFFSPVNSRYKIYIIDEAHMVTREGFNALLKLVEEPPPHLKFVFATTEPEKVIGTIRSRTHHYPFRLIPPSTLKELMEDLLKEEGVSYDPAALPLVVRAGAGSARDTLSVLDQLIAGSDEGGITREGAVSLLGYTDSSLLGEMVDALGARDGAAVFGLIDRVVEGGLDPRRFTTDLLERFRDLVVLAAVPDALDKGLVNVDPEATERMKDQAARLGPAELSRAADILNQGLTEMRGATAPRLLLELMCSRVLLPAADGDQGVALLARLEQMERRIASGALAPPAAPVQPVPAPVQPAPAPAPVTPASPVVP
ncbi:DNA polymerase III subunit gamma and tau, partial [Nocardiopsis dassonvillei]